MKFCKNLQRVVDISDPEWAPYWTNYKMLKKLIKELPSLVPSDEHQPDADALDQGTSAPSDQKEEVVVPSGDTSETKAEPSETRAGPPSDGEVAPGEGKNDEPLGAKDNECGPMEDSAKSTETETKAAIHLSQRVPPRVAMGKSPGEVAFFKLLHAELKKAIHFFERAQEEFTIREERVREGMAIMKKPNSIMLINDRWSVLAKSLYCLYKDLLLLETFAIMTYCSFSKILKKHDKVTGYDTRKAFMSNVVNKANFTNYPDVLEMIQRCEALYEEVSDLLVSEGKQSLYEDERLFISMIHRLNEQAMNTAEAEGAPDVNERKEKKRAKSESPILNEKSYVKLNEPGPLSSATSLRSVVEDNETKAQPVQEASEDENKKRCALASSIEEATDVLKKRPRC